MVGEGGFVGDVVDFGLVGEDEGEAVAVGGAVEDAGVGVAFGELLAGFGDGVFAGAVEFVFPADDFCGGKEGAEGGEKFRGGVECEVENSGVAGEFVAGFGAVDLGDLEITQRGGVEEKGWLGGEVSQGQREGFVCGEGA